MVNAKRKLSLDDIGLETRGDIYWNLTPAELCEHILQNGEGILTNKGAIRILTGKFTGRSPGDKYIVDHDTIQDDIWWGDINQPVSPDVFNGLCEKTRQHLSGKDLYVTDVFAGADPNYRLPVRIVSEVAYHALFAWNMFVRPASSELAAHEPEFTVVAAPLLDASIVKKDNSRSSTFIGVDFQKRIILIMGSLYSGEVKKGIFSVLNYLLPRQGVLSMHCSANIGPDNDTAIFFGLSGTGKTTLSADSSRILIGDDEHAWSNAGIFNIEEGCYAKTINIRPENEPEIYATTQMFGTILENVPLNDVRMPDFTDTRYTENTRCSYPIHYIPNASDTGLGGHPRNVVFLTADAFGILPPISRLSPEQAMYHFISGYTAKVAGTERGISEPQATFSACFGAPFLPLHPMEYATLLADKIRQHDSHVWLINTGWSGGEYGVGERINLHYTRRMVNAALGGELDDTVYATEDYFGLSVPTYIVGVPSEILLPRNTWADKDTYDTKAKELAAMFRQNFKKFEDQATDGIINAGPHV